MLPKLPSLRPAMQNHSAVFSAKFQTTPVQLRNPHIAPRYWREAVSGTLTDVKGVEAIDEWDNLNPRIRLRNIYRGRL